MSDSRRAGCDEHNHQLGKVSGCTECQALHQRELQEGLYAAIQEVKKQMSYEGYVKYAAGEIISVQCFEGRCRECPDGHDSEASDRAPTLENYYCEHGCAGQNEPRPEAPNMIGVTVDRNKDCGALDEIQEMLRDPEWGVGMLEDIGEIVTGTGRKVENYPDDRSTWGRH